MITKKRRTTLLAIAALLLIASPLFAAGNYFTLEGGAFAPRDTSTVDENLSTINVHYTPGYAMGAIVGSKFNRGLRVETELTYRQAKPDAWAFGALVNAWWDILNGSPLTPYLGGGIGYGMGHCASPGIVKNDINGVAYQAGGGVIFDIDPNVSLDFGYRYFGISDPYNSGGVGNQTLAGSSYLLGIRFGF